MTDPQYDDVLRELEETLGAYAAQAPRAEGLAGASRARARHRAHRRAQVTTGVLGIAAAGVVGTIVIGTGALGGGSADSQVGDYAGDAPQATVASDAQSKQSAPHAEPEPRALSTPTDLLIPMATAAAPGGSHETTTAGSTMTAGPTMTAGSTMTEALAPQANASGQLQDLPLEPDLAVGQTRTLPAGSCALIDESGPENDGTTSGGPVGGSQERLSAYRLRVSADGSSCELVRLADVTAAATPAIACPLNGDTATVSGAMARELLILRDEHGQLSSLPVAAGCTPR